MLRVLQVVTHMNRGGLETMLMNYYRHIDRSEIQFDFLTHRSYDGDYGEEIHELGGVIYHLPRLNPFSSTYKKVLKSFFDEHKEYSIIHVHQDCMSSVVLKEAKKHGIPVRIAHSHSSSQDKNVKYLLKLFFMKQIPQCATDLMACGEKAGEWMFSGHSFQVVNNAIDTKKYVYDEKIRTRFRNELGIDPQDVVIGHVGRFSYPKNHTFLIDLFAKFQEGRKATLLLVGDGELRAQMEQKVARLGIAEKVIFTGLRSDVAELMQAMDVFVFPSNYEGLPVTMVEAQAAGLPCLISDKVPGDCIMTDLVEILALEDSVEAWKEKMDALSQRKRENTFDVIRQAGYDIEENARRLQQVYVELVQGYNTSANR